LPLIKNQNEHFIESESTSKLFSKRLTQLLKLPERQSEINIGYANL
jgi:hypothetical protein